MKTMQLGASLLFSLICMPLHAVSFGQVQMQSGLGQPLLAEVPIYDTNDINLQALTIQLASTASHSRLGLDPKFLKDIQISIVADSDGKLFVQLKSDVPYNEPVLTVLLDAQWGNNGRLVKELTALVDPPFIAKTAVQTINAPTVILSPIVAAPSTAPVNPVPAGASDDRAAEPVKKNVQNEKNTVKAPEAKKTVAPVKQSEAAPAKTQVAQRKALQPVQIPATPDNAWKVEQGDNLNDIAIEHNKEIGARIPLSQMMSAIQRANTNAFIKDDPDLLKKGSILRLPNEEQVLAMMPEDAANLLKSQWAKNINAQPAPILNSANKLGNKSIAANKAGTVPAGNAAAATTTQGRLKIVPTVGAMNNTSSQSGASKSGQGQELRVENAQTQEEIATRQSEIATLKTQLDDASKLQAESKRLIELQNSQIKLLTQRMQELEKGTASANAVNPEKAASLQADGAVAKSESPWYYNSNVVIIALLLIAALLGILLKRKK